MKETYILKRPLIGVGGKCKKSCFREKAIKDEREEVLLGTRR